VNSHRYTLEEASAEDGDKKPAKPGDKKPGQLKQLLDSDTVTEMVKEACESSNGTLAEADLVGLYMLSSVLYMLSSVDP
jgi:hypothetical protein